MRRSAGAGRTAVWSSAYRTHVSGTPKWRSVSVEDYLKSIYSLDEQSATAVTTTALTSRLGVSISSCSGMIRRLAELGLVEHARYGTSS